MFGIYIGKSVLVDAMGRGMGWGLRGVRVFFFRALGLSFFSFFTVLFASLSPNSGFQCKIGILAKAVHIVMKLLMLIGIDV